MELLTRILLESIAFIIKLLVLTTVFYIAGILIVGRKRALYADAFVIALLGNLASIFFMAVLPGLVIFTFDGHKFGLGSGLGLLISLFVYLLLIRYYYETGWLGALAVAILAVIVYIVLAFVLALLLLIPFLFLA